MQHGASSNLTGNDVTATQTGMNAAIRAVTRMGIYVGAQVYLIYEVSALYSNQKGKRGSHSTKVLFFVFFLGLPRAG